MFSQQNISPMCILNGLGYCTDVKLVCERQTIEKSCSLSLPFSFLSSMIISCLRETYLLLMGISLSGDEPTKITGFILTVLQLLFDVTVYPLSTIFYVVLKVGELRDRWSVYVVFNGSSYLLYWVYCHSFCIIDGSLNLRRAYSQFIMVMKCFLSGSINYFRHVLLYLLRKERVGNSCFVIEWKYWMKVSMWIKYSPLNCLYQQMTVNYEYFIVSPFFFCYRDFFIYWLSLKMGFSFPVHVKLITSSIICLKCGYSGLRCANSFKNISLNLTKSAMESKVPSCTSSQILLSVSLVS